MAQTGSTDSERHKLGTFLLRAQKSHCWSVFIGGPLADANREGEIVARFKDHVYRGSAAVAHASFQVQCPSEKV